MKLIQCNKCSKKKPEKEWYTNNGPWVDGHIAGQQMNIYFDLCEQCGTKLAQYVKKYFGIKDEKIS